MEVFRQYFGKIRVLRIETIGDRNFTKMLQLMMADPTFPWFETVHTIKVYQVRYLKDMELLKKFFTRFRSLKVLKGITEDEFNPLDTFIKEGKRVNSISWTIPEKPELRTKVMDFLQFNQTIELKLYGGTLEKIKLDTLHLGEQTKSLTLVDMPSIEMPLVYETLPELTSFHIQNVDEFKKENFLSVARRLVTYKGLQSLGLELVTFDLEEVKREFLEILTIH